MQTKPIQPFGNFCGLVLNKSFSRHTSKEMFNIARA
jgi:hypothetical protein